MGIAIEDTRLWTAAGGVAITPSNTNVIGPFRAMWVGGTGDVAVRMIDGTTPIYSAVPVGTVLPIQFDKVLVTGTSATLMIGMK